MKLWYQSVTVWVNLVSFLTLAAALLNNGDYAALFTPELLKIVGLIVALLNIAVRVFITNQPVEKKLL